MVSALHPACSQSSCELPSRAEERIFVFAEVVPHPQCPWGGFTEDLLGPSLLSTSTEGLTLSATLDTAMQ